MRPKAEWAIDSEAMCSGEIVVLAKSNAIQPPLFWFSKPALFATSGLYTFSKVQLVVYHQCCVLIG